MKGLEMKSSWIIWVGPKCSYKRQREDMGIIQEDLMKTEAEIGVMKSQGKKCLEPPEVERGKEIFSSIAFG